MSLDRATFVDPLVEAAQQEIDRSRRLRTSETVVTDDARRWGNSIDDDGTRSDDGDAVGSPAPPQPHPFHRSTLQATREGVVSGDSIGGPSQRIPAETLEEAVSSIRSLQREVHHLRAAVNDSEQARHQAAALYSSEMRKRQEADIQLRQYRDAMEERSSALDASERRYRAVSHTLAQLTSELRNANADGERLREQLSELRRQATSLGEAADGGQAKAMSLERRVATLEGQLEASQKETTEWRHKCSALEAEQQDAKRHHDAAMELLQAKSATDAASLQAQIDGLVSRLEASKHAADQDAYHQSTEYTTLLHKLHHTEERLHAAEHLLQDRSEEAAQRKGEVDALRAEAVEKTRRAELTISQLQEKYTSAQKAADELRTRQQSLEAQVAELKDVNHLLAVRLKSAACERDALAMEVETKKLLARQNEEMEKQLVELRRTLQSLIQHPSSSPLPPPPPPSISNAASQQWQRDSYAPQSHSHSSPTVASTTISRSHHLVATSSPTSPAYRSGR